jgi:hypothetical protein
MSWKVKKIPPLLLVKKYGLLILLLQGLQKAVSRLPYQLMSKKNEGLSLSYKHKKKMLSFH